MPDENTDELLSNPEHYRDLGHQLRNMAQAARSAYARKELLRLAANLEYRARHVGRYYRVSGDPDETGRHEARRTGARTRVVCVKFSKLIM